MTFSIIPVFTIVLLVGLCVYTWITRDKDDNAGDYNNMDRSATWLYLAGTYTATLVSAVGMVGLPGQSQLPVAHPSGQHQGQTLLRSSVRCQL